MVKATLESVVRQTHRPIQLVLVDNNSTDDTWGVLQDFKQKYEDENFSVDVIFEKKQGASAARNTGAKIAKASWLMFFDSDDTMELCLVEKYVEKIKCGNCDVVCTRLETIIGDDKVISFLAKDNFLINHLFHACLSTGRYIIRKKILEKVKGWNESLSYWDDWELGVRILLENPQIAIVDDGVYIHVYAHKDSITGTSYSEKISEAKIAISAVEFAIKGSECKNKIVLLTCVRYRKVLLAGLCKKEGRSDFAAELLREVNRELKGNIKIKILYNLLYYYVSVGGRGSQRIVKFLVK